MTRTEEKRAFGVSPATPTTLYRTRREDQSLRAPQPRMTGTKKRRGESAPPLKSIG